MWSPVRISKYEVYIMSTFIILSILIAIVSLIIYGIIKDRKNGRGACGGSCSQCSANCQYKISKDDEDVCKRAQGQRN